MSEAESQQSDLLNDIRLAKEFLTGPHRSELQGLLADPSADSEKLLKLMSPGEVVMLAAHAIAESPDALVGHLPEPVQKESRALYALAREVVPNFAEHPAVQQVFAEETSDDDEDEDSSEADWRRITGITPSFWWIGDLESLVPYVRLGFRNARRELLLETTASFADLAYLAAALTLLLKNNMARAAEARERGVLATVPVAAGAERISDLLQYASEISEIFEKLIPPEERPVSPVESAAGTTAQADS